MSVELAVFVLTAAIILSGAIGVIVARNPVHSALMLVMTLFGIAVLFIQQDAQFLAAVQVIVYAGAIVVLFLFVIMLLGVDQAEDLRTEPLGGQRPFAAVVVVGLVGLLIAAVVAHSGAIGSQSLNGALKNGTADSNIEVLARALFTDGVFAFELTSVLLVIAVVGAVVLSRKPKREAATTVGKAAS